MHISYVFLCARKFVIIQYFNNTAPEPCLLEFKHNLDYQYCEEKNLYVCNQDRTFQRVLGVMYEFWKIVISVKTHFQKRQNMLCRCLFNMICKKTFRRHMRRECGLTVFIEKEDRQFLPTMVFYFTFIKLFRNA